MSYFKALKTLEFLTIDMLYIKVFLRGLFGAFFAFDTRPLALLDSTMMAELSKTVPRLRLCRRGVIFTKRSETDE